MLNKKYYTYLIGRRIKSVRVDVGKNKRKTVCGKGCIVEGKHIATGFGRRHRLEWAVQQRSEVRTAHRKLQTTTTTTTTTTTNNNI